MFRTRKPPVADSDTRGEDSPRPGLPRAPRPVRGAPRCGLGGSAPRPGAPRRRTNAEGTRRGPADASEQTRARPRQGRGLGVPAAPSSRRLAGASGTRLHTQRDEKEPPEPRAQPHAQRALQGGIQLSRAGPFLKYFHRVSFFSRPALSFIGFHTMSLLGPSRTHGRRSSWVRARLGGAAGGGGRGRVCGLRSVNAASLHSPSSKVHFFIKPWPSIKIKSLLLEAR